MGKNIYGDEKALPAKQAEVLAFIKAEIDAGRGFPDDEAISQRMGWRYPTSARDCLYKLQWRGHVRVRGPERVLRAQVVEGEGITANVGSFEGA